MVFGIHINTCTSVVLEPIKYLHSCKMRWRFRRFVHIVGLWFLTVQAYYLIKWPLKAWMRDGILSAFTAEMNKYSQRTQSLRQEMDSVFRSMGNRALHSKKYDYNVDRKANNSRTLIPDKDDAEGLRNKSHSNGKQKEITPSTHSTKSPDLAKQHRVMGNPTQLPTHLDIQNPLPTESPLPVMSPTNASRLHHANLEDIIFVVSFGGTHLLSYRASIDEDNIDALVQERHNSIVNALQLRLSCTNPSICLPITPIPRWYIFL